MSIQTSTLPLPCGTLHVCDTRDPLNDTCYAFESDHALVGLEAPAFESDLAEWKAYLAALGKPVVGVFVPHHVAGAEALGPTLATQNTVNAAHAGPIHALVQGFHATFGSAFLPLAPIGTVIPEGSLTLGGFDFTVRDEGYGFALDLPSAQLTATHLFGGDCHSLLLSREAIDAALAQCDRLEAAGTRLILSTHHLPEGPDAIAAKRRYLLRLKDAALHCRDAEAFTEALRAAYPTLHAEAYLNMTAAALFPCEGKRQ